MEDITDADYTHAKRVRKDFETKYLGEYHDFYFQRDTLLLSDAFDNFRNMCLKKYEHDPGKNCSAPGLAWREDLKKTKVKVDILTDIDMLLMVQKGIIFSPSVIEFFFSFSPYTVEKNTFSTLL